LPEVDPRLRIVVLAGGVGSRFWPASIPARPKPLLPLGSPDRTLIAETVERALELVPPDRLSILTGAGLVDPILAAVPGLRRERFLVEPRARGTGPALVWAAHHLLRADPDAIMVSLHSDHLIRPAATFRALLARAVEVARREDRLLLCGVPPDRPESGFGYFKPGRPLPAGSGIEAWEVDAFVEKPAPDRARRLIAEGYLWNSGIFILPVARFLEEVRTHAPGIAKHLGRLDGGDAAGFFEEVPGISVDHAVLERSARVGAVRADFDWDDVGSWEALARTRPSDSQGNWVEGEVFAQDSRGCIAWAEEGSIVLFGVEDLVVVRASGVTFVASRSRAPELGSLVERLPEHLRDPDGGEPDGAPPTGEGASS